MKLLNRLRCELQDHIRVTEDDLRDRLLQDVSDIPRFATNTGDYVDIESVMDVIHMRVPHKHVTRCTRCGWTSRRMDG